MKAGDLNRVTSAYVDTGLLAKLYTHEANSMLAVQLVQRYATPLPLTEWQELELKNALRLKAFRQEIDASALEFSLNNFATDLAVGRWQRKEYSHYDLFQAAENLSSGHSIATGCRSLDILHVAAALLIGARDFLTSDGRQAELAKRAGLNVRSV